MRGKTSKIVRPPAHDGGMVRAISDVAQQEAIEHLHAAIDALGVVGVDPSDLRDATGLIHELERVGRRVRGLQVDVMAHTDRRGLHRHDGHASVKVLVRHVGQLSDTEAKRRQWLVEALRHLPACAAALRAGVLGIDQALLVAQTWANERVQDRWVEQDANIVTVARQTSYVEFAAKVAEWVALMDEDGTIDDAERNHDARSCRHRRNDDGSWTTTIRHPSLRGAQFGDRLARFAKDEMEDDWATARAEHGEAATAKDLPRREDQRSYDAMFTMSGIADAADATASGRAPTTTDIVIGADRYERALTRMFADEPLEPLGSIDLRSLGGPAWRCSTLAGHQLDPTEAVLESLLGHVRRVVVGADGVVVDLGRRSRVFRDGAALAVRLGSARCLWPGCEVPVTECQLDHLTPWSEPARGPGGGRTCPDNGGPLCGRHNRYKHHGYRLERDDAGRPHTYRPDGTEIG